MFKIKKSRKDVGVKLGSYFLYSRSVYKIVDIRGNRLFFAWVDGHDKLHNTLHFADKDGMELDFYKNNLGELYKEVPDDDPRIHPKLRNFKSE